MLSRVVLATVTFGWLSYFGLGLLLGELRASGLLYALLGAAFGAVFALTTRGIQLARDRAWRAARICFAIALVLLVWGFVGLVLGDDPVTGRGYADASAAVPGTIALLSAVPALGGLLLLAMRSR